MNRKNEKHNMTGTKEYIIWLGMKQRCYNKKSNGYKFWGGCGVTVCDRWKDSFQNFYNDMGKVPKGTSLDRIDNISGYSKDNCRWADSKTQARNRRSNVFLTYKGETLCITDWCKRFNLSWDKFMRRTNYYKDISLLFDKK